MSTPVKDLIYLALKDSLNKSIIFHQIDTANSAIEVDYEVIADAVIKKLSEFNYKIIQ